MLGQLRIMSGLSGGRADRGREWRMEMWRVEMSSFTPFLRLSPKMSSEDTHSTPGIARLPVCPEPFSIYQIKGPHQGPLSTWVCLVPQHPISAPKSLLRGSGKRSLQGCLAEHLPNSPHLVLHMLSQRGHCPQEPFGFSQPYSLTHTHTPSL